MPGEGDVWWSKRQQCVVILVSECGGPNGFRTRVSGVRGQRPGPLDDGTIQMAKSKSQKLYWKRSMDGKCGEGAVGA